MTPTRRIPPHAVDRPALRLQLDAGVSAPLTLIVAPAGAGKTVLLSQWANNRPDISVAWFDITAADESPVIFAQRLADEISSVVPEFRPPAAPVESVDGRLGEAFLEEFAGSLADVEMIALVFDDLDRISGSPVLADLWRLVDLLPRNAHAVFSSRVDLQLGWSRHRLQHGLVEIRQRELAFDDVTTARVIESIAGKPVSEKAIASVTSRTEGWAVGVQLTALSLRFSADPDRIVEALAGTDRLVVDYLSQEVLDALEPPRRDALVKLAVLDEVCPALVEHLVDVDGARFLEDLERDSLFLVPVPGRPGWLRFHRLFRDLLLYRLRATDPGAEVNLLEAAAEWYLAQHDVERAMDCLIRGQLWQKLIERALSSGRDVFEQVRTSSVAGWLNQVPKELRSKSIDAELLLAIAEGMSGRGPIAVDALQALIENPVLTIGQRQVAQAYLAACVQFHPHPELFLAAADQALTLLEESPEAELPDLLGLTSRPLLALLARGSAGRAHMFLGNLPQARKALTETVELAGLTYAPYRVHALGSLALVDALEGRLKSASERADLALATAREFSLLAHPAPADAYLARAVVAIQRGEPGVGSLAATEGSVRAAVNYRTQLMWLGRVLTILIDPSDDKALAAGEPPGPPPPFARQVLVAMGMRRARSGGTALAPPSLPAHWSPIAFEEVAAYLMEGEIGTARARLTQLKFDYDPLAPVGSIEFELMCGWLCAQEGRKARARKHLEAAVALAAPESIIDPFIRGGSAVVNLVEELVRSHVDFVRLVKGRTRTAPIGVHRGLLDDLTPRELELLVFLPSRMTVAEIAGRCFVSTNTVKTHLGHIYRKLGVSNRDSAIERAVELRLINDAEITRVR